MNVNVFTYPIIIDKAHLLLARALGPQLDSGFSGNLANLSSLEGGLASFRISKEALILCEKQTHTRDRAM